MSPFEPRHVPGVSSVAPKPTTPAAPAGPGTPAPLPLGEGVAFAIGPRIEDLSQPLPPLPVFQVTPQQIPPPPAEQSYDLTGLSKHDIFCIIDGLSALAHELRGDEEAKAVHALRDRVVAMLGESEAPVTQHLWLRIMSADERGAKLVFLAPGPYPERVYLTTTVKEARKMAPWLLSETPLRITHQAGALSSWSTFLGGDEPAPEPPQQA